MRWWVRCVQIKTSILGRFHSGHFVVILLRVVDYFIKRFTGISCSLRLTGFSDHRIFSSTINRRNSYRFASGMKTRATNQSQGACFGCISLQLGSFFNPTLARNIEGYVMRRDKQCQNSPLHVLNILAECESTWHLAGRTCGLQKILPVCD